MCARVNLNNASVAAASASEAARNVKSHVSGLVVRALMWQVAEAAAKKGDLAGTLFWHWYDRGIGRAWLRSLSSTPLIVFGATGKRMIESGVLDSYKEADLSQ